MKNSDHVKDMLRHDFNSFIGFSFRELYPRGEYQDNWHVQALAEALTKVGHGDIKRLIVTMPPRMLKSHCTSIAFVTWMLGRDPHKKFLLLHGSSTLGQNLHHQRSALMARPRYRWLFDHIIIEARGTHLMTSFGGGCQYLPIQGPLTGLGADYIIIDDPISPLHAQNDHERQRLNNQFDQNILQRLNNKKSGAIIVVMQRLHENDLVGHLLSKDDGWVHIDMPAIALKDEIWELPHGKTYKRRKGEVLHEARESLEQLSKILDGTHPYAFAYQYLQGQYKPRFGPTGKGCLWTTAYPESGSGGGLLGFVHYDEKEFILAEAFGTIPHPYPDSMRRELTREEWEMRYGSMKHDPTPIPDNFKIGDN
jgi:hypothetical protein